MKTTRAKLFREYMNDFLTVDGFATHYKLDRFKAEVLLQLGKEDHEEGREITVIKTKYGFDLV